MIVNAHAADHRSQAIALEVAVRHHDHWTTKDLEFVQAFSDDRDEDIAIALGRSLYAIRGIRGVLTERMERAQRRANGAGVETVITSFDAWERSFDE